MVQMPGPAPVSVLLCKRSSTIAVHWPISVGIGPSSWLFTFLFFGKNFVR